MADNTTEYKVIVDTEVTGGEQIEQLGDEADKTGGKFKSLKSQIRETTVGLQKLADEGKEGTAEFEKLRQKLDDLNDAQDRVNFQAGQFDDQLAALPGPIGQVGGALKGFQEGLNKFSLGFKLALGAVVLIIGAIAAFKESLSRTAEGLVHYRLCAVGLRTHRALCLYTPMRGGSGDPLRNGRRSFLRF
jgi:hypothetical protein